MTSVTDILTHAYNRDASNLMPALDAVLTDKITNQIDALRVDMSASLLSPVTQEDHSEAPEELEVSDQGTNDE